MALLQPQLGAVTAITLNFKLIWALLADNDECALPFDVIISATQKAQRIFFVGCMHTIAHLGGRYVR